MVTGIVGRELFKLWSNRKLAGTFLFNTGHSGLELSDYPKHLKQLGVRPLFLVHDLIPIAHPEYSRPGELDKHVVRINRVLGLAHGVITNSKATLNELERYALESRHRMPPSIAAPLAAPELPLPSVSRPIPEPYFVILGTIEPRKNHWLVLHVWRRLIERHGAKAPRLVVIGQRGWECENVVDLLERCATLRGFVTELPACSDGVLATYLHHSNALLFPSFAEGYGLPLVEALSLGAPVIASDLPVFREIANDIPDYLDPLDGMGWMARIEAFADLHSPMRMAQLNRMRSFVTPNWSTHFQAVEGLMERLA
jgi:glycosyltransferase involved in cell wall biosynthesis